MISRARSWLRGKPALIGSLVRSRWLLRDCDERGRWSRVTDGRPILDNAGRIELGERVRLTCQFVPVELRAVDGGSIRIGDRVAINYGSSVTAAARISIGDRVSIGPYCVLDDRSTHADPALRAEPIVIEDDVWLASRVVVEPGARIGAGAVVTAGSVVGGEVPPRVVVGGAPARVLRRLDESEVAPVEHSAAPDGDAVAPPAVAVRFEPAVHGLVISDFTVDPLAEWLEQPAQPPAMRLTIAPFGQVVQSLAQPPESGRDLAVVWTDPASVLPSYRGMLEGRAATVAEVAADVEDFVALVRQGLGEFRFVFLPTWTQPAWRRGRGVADLRPGGLRWALTNANLRLAELLEQDERIVVLDAERWQATDAGGGSHRALWYRAKMPFPDEVFVTAAGDVAAAYLALTGARRKLLIVDLDNTLWGGVVGDAGVDGLVLGGHDAVGEAYVDLQHALLRLKRQGILLAVVSKNEEATALAAIDGHDAMVVRTGDLAGWRINWDDKAKNIADLVAELNLGLQSVVFLDDNPHERARVAAALPEVLVPEWSDDPIDAVPRLEALGCFDVLNLTDEDLARGDAYVVERQRRSLRASVGSLDEWLGDLDTVVTVRPLGDANIVRAAQLLNKTNQMNLSTRRLSEGELLDWSRGPGRRMLTLSVADRLGDAGLTGLIGLEVGDDGEARLVDFVLSCRVMGRRIEEAMVAIASQHARAAGAARLQATVVPTSKNEPCVRFFAGSRMTEIEPNRYVVELDEPIATPELLAVKDEVEA